ncbi:phosphatase PAP2 family protein [Legionella sp. km772]|uniref:phosphatase PAP2 family protein n=1 Tax=Legionella sp. km772 TaxID=2498111 RepID=UPI000F8E68DF|nr:phosphatase PAP2 family protein [Legionella sp. km772]RUR13658.1 phosphatase PAP2 family protein [Legionella sp. km772]
MNAGVLKKYQIETYVLIIFPILWILVSGFFEKPWFSIIRSDHWDLWSRSLFFGGDMLKLGFIVIYIYLYFKLFIWLSGFIRRKLFKEQIPASTNMKLFLASFLYMTFAVFCATLLLIYTVRQSSMLSSTSKMISSSELYMQIDLRLFPKDPRIQMVDFFTHSSWDFWLTYIYRKLDWVFALVLIGLVLFKKTLFRKYLLAFFLAPTIALPMWLAGPAITPNEMYRVNMFSVPAVTPYQEAYKKLTLGPHLDKFLNYVGENIENPVQKYPIISTNPSMHVCWGFLITYFAILLWRPLAFIFIPWFVLTALSTIYTFQHYLIDIPAGILCAIITLMATSYLLKFEQRYYTGDYRALYFLDVFQEDAKKCLSFIRNYKKKNALNLGSSANLE